MGILGIFKRAGPLRRRFRHDACTRRGRIERPRSRPGPSREERSAHERGERAPRIGGRPDARRGARSVSFPPRRPAETPARPVAVRRESVDLPLIFPLDPVGRQLGHCLPRGGPRSCRGRCKVLEGRLILETRGMIRTNGRHHAPIHLQAACLISGRRVESRGMRRAASGSWRKHLFHYTNNKGYNAISSQVVWLFKASKPPCNHPRAAYFTTLPPGTRNLSKRLFVRGCAEKTEFVFSFSGGEDLPRLRGGRGDHIHYSGEDYPVEEPRQGRRGRTDQVREELA